MVRKIILGPGEDEAGRRRSGWLVGVTSAAVQVATAEMTFCLDVPAMAV
jgi:hypothetical protein